MNKLIKMFPARFALAMFAAILLQGQALPMRTYAIVDPVFKMTAWTVPVPANWKADGTMVPGSSCNNSTSPVLRTMSSDGLAGYYLLPRYDWGWGAGIPPVGDCLPWKSMISAKDFMTYQTRIDKVGFVRALPTPGLAGLRKSLAQYGGVADVARWAVRYSVNGHDVEEIRVATITCQTLNVYALGQKHVCSATVQRLFAPLGKLDAMTSTFNAMQLSLNQAWMQTWTSAMVNRTRRLYQSETDAMLAQGRLAGAQRMQAHTDFMASMAQGRDARNLQFQAGQYQKQRNADNYVDYILDCQRAYSATARVSSANCPGRQTR